MTTPELDKMHAVHEESQAIGAFLKWLDEQGIVFCTWEQPTESRLCTGVTRDSWDRDNCGGTGVALRSVTDPSSPRDRRTYLIEVGDQCGRCHGTGHIEYPGAEQFVPDYMSIEKRLAEYFDIDLNKVEQEKRALLASLR